MKKKDEKGDSFYHSDHLGSTSLVTDQNGNVLQETRYMPYGLTLAGGDDRFLYTGQEADDTGLMYYNARYYDPFLRQFTQADTILPNVYDPQQLNRYSYVTNNPYRYVDPSGHIVDTIADVGFIGYDLYEIYNDPWNWRNWAALGGDAVGAALPFVTGLGAGIKIVTKADDIVDVGRAVDKTYDSIKHGDDLIDVIRADTAGDAASMTNHLDDAILDYVFMNPKNIKYSQGKIKKTFSHGDHKGQSVDDLVANIKSGKVKPSEVDPIAIVEIDGLYYSLDNRRLYAFKQAGVDDIPTVLVDLNNPQIKANFDMKFVNQLDGGNSIEIIP